MIANLEKKLEESSVDQSSKKGPFITLDSFAHKHPFSFYKYLWKNYKKLVNKNVMFITTAKELELLCMYYIFSTCDGDIEEVYVGAPDIQHMLKPEPIDKYYDLMTYEAMSLFNYNNKNDDNHYINNYIDILEILNDYHEYSGKKIKIYSRADNSILEKSKELYLNNIKNNGLIFVSRENGSYESDR